MNKWIGMGRLTGEPAINNTQDGKKVARLTLAVDRRVARNADGHTEADFIPVVAWEKKAEFAEKYLHKGSKVVVTGRIQTGSYTNREGNRVYTTDIVAEDIEFAESKRAETQAEHDTGFMKISPEEDQELPFN